MRRPLVCAIALLSLPVQAGGAADTIYFNGTVETLDRDFRRAEALCRRASSLSERRPR